ncbi:MAG TPA: VOC family protein [Ornithinibacter sp.]|nr:VOC family protein [Ornithinibacter sp.]
MIDVRWMWLFLDTPRADAPRSWAFWSEVTGWPLSATRGDEDEFATLLPPDGDAWLKLQAVADGRGGIHLDLDVDDVVASAVEAERLGARRIGAIGDEVVILRSPGGQTFCLTPWHGDAEQVREGAAELVDQVCLDCPSDVHDAEVAFWASLTGWQWVDVDEPELSRLRRPAGVPFRLLFQRLGEATGVVRAHADLACVDRAASLVRHVAAGARVGQARAGWTVMTDPAGRVYCLTDRSPTGPR